MNLTPVESSHIAAIGYLEAERVLLVRFKEGGLYAWANFSSTAWLHLQAAQSKGKFLAACKDFGSGVLIAKGVMPHEPVSYSGDHVAAPGGNEAPSSGALNVIDEDADKCCRAYFARIHRTNFVGLEVKSLSCPDCGQEFTAQVVGATRYWRIVPAFAVHRRGQ